MQIFSKCVDLKIITITFLVPCDILKKWEIPPLH